MAMHPKVLVYAVGIVAISFSLEMTRSSWKPRKGFAVNPHRIDRADDTSMQLLPPFKPDCTVHAVKHILFSIYYLVSCRIYRDIRRGFY